MKAGETRISKAFYRLPGYRFYTYSHYSNRLKILDDRRAFFLREVVTESVSGIAESLAAGVVDSSLFNGWKFWIWACFEDLNFPAQFPLF